MPAPAAPALLTRWRSTRDIAGTVEATTWAELLGELAQPRVYAGDTEHPGWSPVLCDPPLRKDENVKSIAALVLDIDEGATIEQVLATWGRFYGLVHTTRKHTADAHRVRVVLPLSRHISPAEHARLWAAQNEFAARHGITLDSSTRNPSRFWYLPGTKPGAPFEAHELTGAPLDVDAALHAFDEKPSTNNHAPPAPLPFRSVSVFDKLKRARAYLAKMAPAISGSGGHAATWNAAIVLVRGFDLSADVALDVLAHEYNPRCSPPWSLRELRHKVLTADRDGRVAHGYLLEDERRDWHARQPPPISAYVASAHLGPDARYEAEERAAMQGDGAPSAFAGIVDESEQRYVDGAEGGDGDGAGAPPRPTSIFAKLSVGDIFAPLPPVPWLVEHLDLCPGAPAMIAGYGFSRKTIAAQALALSVATGRALWGQFACRQGRVLHIDYEQGRRLTLQRYQRLALGMGIDASELADMLDVVVLPPFYLDAPNAGDVLMREFDGYGLVVIDSFRAAAPSAEENSSDIRRHLDVLTRAAEKSAATPVVIHHARKTSKENGADARQALRGSSGIFDACSSVLVFSAEKGEPTLVQHEKARTSGMLAEEFYLQTFDTPSYDGVDPRAGLRVETMASQQAAPKRTGSKFDELKVSIVDLVRRERTLTSKNAICARISGSSKEAKLEALRELLNNGVLVQPGGEGQPYRVNVA